MMMMTMTETPLTTYLRLCNQPSWLTTQMRRMTMAL